MRLRNIPGAQEKLAAYPQYVVDAAQAQAGKWQERFPKAQALHLEIGSGKGRFITEMAKAHPDINYIAMEVQTSVALRILERQLEADLPNLQILHGNGASVEALFAEDEIDRIYLNFSDPWPKARHTKRRLTSPTFLESYEKILKDTGEIHFKTDNQGLFEYSLHSLSTYGMSFANVSLDLHNSAFEGNIMTEYEEKFSQKGHRIYRLEARFK